MLPLIFVFHYYTNVKMNMPIYNMSSVYLTIEIYSESIIIKGQPHKRLTRFIKKTNVINTYIWLHLYGYSC